MDFLLKKGFYLDKFSYSPLNWALAFPPLKSLPFQAFDYEANALSIRLLRILPSKDISSEIQCEVFHAVIGHNCPSYDALSYVWGDPRETASIRLNGKRHQVTVNLEVALHYLRGTEARVMWIDAICINQQDLREKNYQVQRMRSIYLNARVVVIWLGEEGTAQRALNFCQLIQTGGTRNDSWDGTFNADIIACFDLFVHRPYWNRIWTVQEVCHDREIVVQLGNLNPKILELQEYYRKFRMTFLQGRDNKGQVTYERYFRVASLPPPVIWGRHKFSKLEKVETSNTMFSGYTKRQPLLDLLQSTRAMEASDPRDKVFALHGLVKEHELITVDYNASKKDVYTQTITELLSNDHTALEDILLSVESVGADNDLPSWVPDLSAKQRSIPLVMRLWARCFTAADSVGSLTLYKDGELGLIGYNIGRITSTSDAKIEDSSIQDDELKRFSLIGFTVNLPFTNLLSAPITRRNSNNIHSVNISQSNTSRGSFFLKKDSLSPSILNQDKLSVSLLGAKHGDKPPFLTKSWGPLSAQVGDVICCLNGCRIPLVLREISLTRSEKLEGYTEPRFHKLVGACFLIDSELEATPDFMNDPGFSPIMRGSIWKTVYDTEHREYFCLK